MKNQNIITKRKDERITKLENIKKLLINIDMVNGFIRVGALHDPKIAEIIPEQFRLIEMFLRNNDGLAFVKEAHEENCREFDRYPVHCLKGTHEAELVDELKPYEKDALVYLKNSTSAIFAPNFMDDIKQMKNLKEIVITGCCTDICDFNLAVPLNNYFDQVNRRVQIVMPTNAVETFDAPFHNREEYTEAAYKLLRQAGIKLVKKYEGGNK
jgi:nicotinamidase-related amidase